MRAVWRRAVSVGLALGLAASVMPGRVAADAAPMWLKPGDPGVWTNTHATIQRFGVAMTPERGAETTVTLSDATDTLTKSNFTAVTSAVGFDLGDNSYSQVITWESDGVVVTCNSGCHGGGAWISQGNDAVLSFKASDPGKKASVSVTVGPSLFTSLLDEGQTVVDLVVDQVKSDVPEAAILAAYDDAVAESIAAMPSYHQVCDRGPSSACDEQKDLLARAIEARFEAEVIAQTGDQIKQEVIKSLAGEFAPIIDILHAGIELTKRPANIDEAVQSGYAQTTTVFTYVPAVASSVQDCSAVTIDPPLAAPLPSTAVGKCAELGFEGSLGSPATDEPVDPRRFTRSLGPGSYSINLSDPMALPRPPDWYKRVMSCTKLECSSGIVAYSAPLKMPTDYPGGGFLSTVGIRGSFSWGNAGFSLNEGRVQIVELHLDLCDVTDPTQPKCDSSGRDMADAGGDNAFAEGSVFYPPPKPYGSEAELTGNWDQRVAAVTLTAGRTYSVRIRLWVDAISWAGSWDNRWDWTRLQAEDLRAILYY